MCVCAFVLLMSPRIGTRPQNPATWFNYGGILEELDLDSEAQAARDHAFVLGTFGNVKARVDSDLNNSALL